MQGMMYTTDPGLYLYPQNEGKFKIECFDDV